MLLWFIYFSYDLLVQLSAITEFCSSYMTMTLTVLDQGLKRRLILLLQFEIDCEYNRFGMQHQILRIYSEFQYLHLHTI